MRVDDFILEVKNLSVRYRVHGERKESDHGWIKAVDDVSIQMRKGETFGLVGESGSGKSTVARALVGLAPIHQGEIVFEGKTLQNLGMQTLPEKKRIQMIFQDPNHTLNPRHTVGMILEEPLKLHFKEWKKEQRRERISELLIQVGLDSSAIQRYPHQFSGGQRQRIGIARAISVEPQVIICDEVVSALDVSVQAQIINLLQDLQEQFGFTYLFIAHDLAVIEHISDQVAVMNAGKIVETGTSDEIYENPQCEYTKKLFDSVPKLESLG